jgi:hypothetical protein
MRKFRDGYGFTLESCQLYCYDYKYFALQDYHEGHGSQCFCENDFDHLRMYGKGECGEKGGGWCNFVYESQPFPQKNKYEGYIVAELGGYKDQPERAMKFGPGTRSYDKESCNQACVQYKYFALQDGEKLGA